jgi:hypothetical protein
VISATHLCLSDFLSEKSAKSAIQKSLSGATWSSRFRKAAGIAKDDRSFATADSSAGELGGLSTGALRKGIEH